MSLSRRHKFVLLLAADLVFMLLFMLGVTRLAKADILVVMESGTYLLKTSSESPSLERLYGPETQLPAVFELGDSDTKPPPPEGLAAKITAAARKAEDPANAKELSATYAAAIQALAEGTELVPVLTVLKAGEAVLLNTEKERSDWADYLALTQETFRSATKDAVRQIASGLAAVAPAEASQSTLEAIRKQSTANATAAIDLLPELAKPLKSVLVKKLDGVTVDVTLAPERVRHSQSDKFRSIVVDRLRKEGAKVNIADAVLPTNAALPIVVVSCGGASIEYKRSLHKLATWKESIIAIADRLPKSNGLATH